MRDRRKPADNTLVRLAWAVGLIWIASSALAFAQEPALSWQAPAACPAREAWLGSLRARVDPTVWAEAAPKLRASVRIEARASGYALALETELDGATGQRQLEAARCEELVEASALIVALAIDPSAAERAASANPIVAPEATPASPAPVTAGAAAPAAAPAEPVPAEPQPEQPDPEPKRPILPVPVPAKGFDGERPPAPERSREPGSMRFFVRPLVLLDAATLPQLALGPSLQGGARIQRLHLELGASYLLAQSLSAPDGVRGVVGEIRWLAGSAGACYSVVRIGGSYIAPCARIEVGWLWGRGRNLDQDTFSGGATWLALVPGAVLSYELVRGFAVNAELGAALPLLASAFTVGGVGEVHESPGIALRFAAGFTLYL